MKVMKGEAAISVARSLLSRAIALVVCVSLGFVSYASAQQPSSASIVGRWRSLETTKGGIGQIWTFGSDDALDFSLGAVVQMPWRIEKNQLVFPPETTDGPEQKATLKWLGDNNLKLEGEGGVVELARVGNRPDPGNPLIGEWIENHDMGGHKVEAHYLFYSRGEVLLLIPFKIEHYSYSISGSALHLAREGKTREFTFKLADDRLTVSPSEGGEELHFARY